MKDTVQKILVLNLYAKFQSFTKEKRDHPQSSVT